MPLLYLNEVHEFPEHYGWYNPRIFKLLIGTKAIQSIILGVVGAKMVSTSFSMKLQALHRATPVQATFKVY
jgi:hypothetical protein